METEKDEMWARKETAQDELECKRRAEQFLQWLLARPERTIAVVIRLCSVLEMPTLCALVVCLNFTCWSAGLAFALHCTYAISLSDRSVAAVSIFIAQRRQFGCGDNGWAATVAYATKCRGENVCAVCMKSAACMLL